MMKAPRVCIIAISPKRLGGHAVQATELIKLYKQDSIDVAYIYTDPELPGLYSKLQRVKYVRTITTFIAYVFSLLTEIPKYDVCHIFSASYYSFLIATAPAVIISRLFRKMTIINYHSGEAEDHLKKWGWHALPLLKLANVIVVPSDFLKDVFEKFGFKTEVIYNVLDLNRYHHIERNTIAPKCLVTRSLSEPYDIYTVLKAFAIVKKQRSDATLTIAGTGILEQKLKDYVEEQKIKGTCFIGRVSQDDLPAIYAQHDIYLNASRIDNAPISLSEALATGLVVITTNAGGIPYMIKDSKNGFLIDIGNYEMMAERVFFVLNNEKISRKVSQNARQSILHQTWEKNKLKWLRLYGITQ